LNRRSERGFSLVEMLVATGISALLMAGMFQIFTASQKSFNRVNENLGAQRSMRWSLDMVADDFQMMGYFFPPPSLTYTPVAASADPGTQSCLMIIPHTVIQKLKGTVMVDRDPLTDDKLEVVPASPKPPKPADEISFVSDSPLPVTGTLSTAIKLLNPFVTDPATQTSDVNASNSVSVNLAQQGVFQVGDIIMVNDPNNFEFARITASMTVNAGSGTAIPVSNINPDAGSGAFTFKHLAGTAVSFVRPLRIVRYALIYLAIGDTTDPDTGGLVPCLCRFETAYTGTTVPDWAGMLTSPPTVTGTVNIVAENVTSFQVDFTLDTQFPGVRNTTYANTLANIDAAILRVYGRGGETTNISDPLWFRKYPGLFRITIETRSPMARAEGTGSAVVRQYKYRTQVLMLYPRNFGVDRSMS
jgi:prepilin-type N-terminal cleavage/methylation domain-containing protein